jgi:type IV pilus assembly protein PilV
MLNRSSPPSLEVGVTLIEALVAMAVFSIGILGLIGLQANSITLASEAKYRAEAAFLTNQLIGQLAVSDLTTYATFAHNTTGSVCAPTGGASGNAAITAWVADVNQAFAGVNPKTQIKVPGTNDVIVSICWQLPNGAPHSHVVRTQMQWQ